MLAVIGYTTVLFMLKTPMSVYNAVVPVIGMLIYGFAADRRLLPGLITDILIIAVWSVICVKMTDWSYDGMYYHKEAIITLEKGWNPIYQSCAQAEALNANADLALWLDNYPKGIWMLSAALYILTDFIETAKAVNIFFIIILYGTAYSALRDVFAMNRKKAVCFSFLICLNPVYICQIFTSYNDLAVGVLIMTAVFLGMKIYSECADIYDCALLLCVCALSCLVKFTAPLLVGIILIVYGGSYALKKKGIRAADFKKPAVIILAGFISGTLFFGFDPYVKHLMNGQNLVYPVLGENHYDIMNSNPPKGFENKTGIGKYFISLFSKTANDHEEQYELKFPFTVYKSEFESLSNADIRLGGFGVLFGGILILSVAAALLSAIRYKHKMKAEALIALAAFIGLGLFFPEAWWARYASYTYYIPIFLTLYVSECKRTALYAYIITLLVAANSIITAAFVIKDGTFMTNYFDNMLNEIKAEKKEVEIRINDFPSHLVMFEEKGIPYRLSEVSLTDEIVFYADTKYKFIN